MPDSWEEVFAFEGQPPAQDQSVGAIRERIGRVAEVFARNCRYRRTVLGMSQELVAMKLNAYGLTAHQTVIAKIEAGQRAVKLAEAYALAEVYRLSVGDLMYGQGLDEIGIVEVDFPFKSGTPRFIRAKASLPEADLQRAADLGLKPQTP